MKDVAFYFRKKTGIPKMVDSGLADVLLGGEGLTVINFMHYGLITPTNDTWTGYRSSCVS